jgi:hypothetical protein
MTKRQFTVKKSLGGSQTYRGWNDYAEGDTVVGTFVGIHTCQYKRENFKLKVLDAQFEDQDLAETLIGKTLVLNAAATLSKQMSEVEEGDTIAVEYTGKFIVSSGPNAGKESHGISVSVVEMEDEAESGL